MRALLVAAGMGSRLRPITDTLPKCLVEVGGKTLLDHWLDMLVPAGVAPVLVNLHYRSEQVLEHLKQSVYFRQVQTVFEEELLGTGGTLRANEPFFGNETFLMAHADNLSRFSMSQFLQKHRERPAGCAITMLVFEAEDPQSCGIVVTDEAGLVQGFYEKVSDPPGKLASGAVFVMEPEVFSVMRTMSAPAIDFSRDVLPEFVGRIQVFDQVEYHRDIGTPQSLERAKREWDRLIF